MGKDPLSEEEIAAKLAALRGWVREGDTITRTFGIRYHGGVAMIVNIADVQRLIGHHADIDLRWDHVRFAITTHDVGHRLTAADFDLASADRPDRCGTPGTVPQRLTGSRGTFTPGNDGAARLVWRNTPTR